MSETSSSTAILEQLFTKWDAAMAVEMPDFEVIYAEMLQKSSLIANRPVATEADADFWWRISKAIFGITYKYDVSSQQAFIEEKLTEAVNYADRALAVAPKNFEANLAKARAVDRMSFFARTTEGKVECLEQITKAVAVCAEHADKFSAEPLMPYLQANLLSLLWATCEPEIMTAIEENETTKSLVPLEPAALEGKLRRSIEQLPGCIEAYLALVALLAKMGKYPEARVMVNIALAIPKKTVWQQSLQPMLEMAREHLVDL